MALSILVGLSNAPAYAQTETAEVIFIAAEKALARDQQTIFAQLYQRLAGHPLRPYLQAERLRQQLPDGLNEAQVFLTQQGNAPAVRSLRTAVLGLLAKDGAWDTWLRYYQGSTANVQRCHHAQALWQTGRTAQAATHTQSLWLNGKSMPDACDGPFAKWRQAGGLSNQLVLARIALAVRSGNPSLARYLGKRLPPEDRKVMNAWVRLGENPKRVVDLPLQRYPALTDDMVAYAIRRMARVDDGATARFWRQERHRRPYSSTAVKRADEWIGLFLASSHNQEAVTWLASIKAPVRDQVRYWRITSALRHDQWRTAELALNRLLPEEIHEPRWQYWRGRVAERANQWQMARQAYANAAGDRSFHGFLAADRIGRPYSLNAQTFTPASAALKRLSNHPVAQRAHAWLTLGRYTEARREWYHLLDQLHKQEDRIVAAHVAHNWNWHGMAIVTLGRAKALDFLSLRFPTPYDPILRQEAQRAGISPLWARAIMRRESAYLNQVRSSAGAMGVMQLMPATARGVAKSLGLRLRRNAQLFSPALNIKFGTTYLARLDKRLNGHMALATAAYNAGPHRIPRWRPQSVPLDGDIWAETIPFKETRRYVRAVLAYKAIHGMRNHYPNVRVSEALTPVAEGQ